LDVIVAFIGILDNAIARILDIIGIVTGSTNEGVSPGEWSPLKDDEA
jgi:hypothetical protein